MDDGRFRVCRHDLLSQSIPIKTVQKRAEKKSRPENEWAAHGGPFLRDVGGCETADYLVFGLS